MKKPLFLRHFTGALILLLCATLVRPEGAQAIGYGGIGGEPALPREGEPRSESIFLHTIEPGGIRQDAVRVINNTATEKTVRVYAVDSEIASGGAFSCGQQSAPKNGVGGWVALEKKTLTLAPASNKVIPFSIAVPDGALPGGHDGCIVIEEADGEVKYSPGINLKFRTGIRVSVTVPGDIRQEVVPVGFRIDTKKKSDGKKALVLHPQVRNVGNVPVDTKASVFVDSLFGKRTMDNEARFTVPRGEATGWNFETDAPFWGGIFKAGYTIEYERKIFPRFFAETPPEGKQPSPMTAGLQANVFGDEGNGIKDFLPAGNIVAEGDIVRLQGPTEWFFVAPVLEALIIEVSALSLLLLMAFFWWLSLWRKRWIRLCWVEHRVSRGQNINSLADRHDVSWKIIAKANRLSAPYSLKTGQNILLPPLETDDDDDS